MLLESDSWHLGYSQIVQDCRPVSLETDTSLLEERCSLSSGGTVLMLCNPDADALCAARILSYAFRADGVLYQLRPCGGCSRLVQILSRLKMNEFTDDALHQDNSDVDVDHVQKLMKICTIRAIVLINLGATRNLSKLLFSPTPIKENDPTLQLPAGETEEKSVVSMRPSLLVPEVTKVYVLDSHRPYHLANVHAGMNIVLWNDFSQWHDDLDAGGLPSDGDGLSGNEEDTDEESNSVTDREYFVEEDEKNNETMFEFDTGEGYNRQKIEDDDRRDLVTQDILQDSNGERNSEEYNDELTENNSKKRLNISNLKKNFKRKTLQCMKKVDMINSNGLPFTGRQSDDGKFSKGSEINPVSKRELRKERRNRIRLYYTTGTYYSSPVSFMTYTLISTQLRFENVGDLLWLACIGITDAYIHNRLDVGGYALFSVELRRHVNRVYPTDSGSDRLLQRNFNTFYAESLYNNNNGEANTEKNLALQTRVGHSENGRILYQNNEFRFFLLRHISLWESMKLSPHVCTTMELWRPSGEKKLKEMLAKMGMPIVQCRQPYAFMKPVLKRRLRDMVLNHADEYGLTNISYTGFIRVTGYKSFLSASDMSLAVTALLECETSSNHGSKNDNDSLDNSHDNKTIYYSPGSYDSNEEEHDLFQSFNVAYDALNANGSSSMTIPSIGCMDMGNSSHVEGSDLSNLVNGGQIIGNTGLGAGIRLAIHLQRNIISTAVSLVERSAITRLSHFRYAYLHCTNHGSSESSSSGPTVLSTGYQKSNLVISSGKDMKEHPHHIFAKPLALTKLAYFLMDMHRTNNKWTGTRARPLVLMAEKPRTGTYVVVGYEYPEERGNIGKNRFGQNFELASKTMRGYFKFDSFDSNVVEVKANDVQRFIEHLHYMMDSV